MGLRVLPDQILRLGGGGLRAFGPGGDAYVAKALRIANLLAGYSFNDQNAGGTTVLDFSGNNRHAVSEQVIYNWYGVGQTAFVFNGKTGYLSFYSAALNAALDVNECTLAWWIKAPTVGVWGDSTIRNFVRINNAGGNALDIRKTATANQIQVNLWCSPTNLIKLVTITPSTNWLHIAVTISRSNNRMITYINGTAQTPTTGLTTAWSGALSSTGTLFGALSQSNQQVWNGLADNLLIYGRELTAAEVLDLATFTPPSETRSSFMAYGDSKTWGQNDSTSTFANGNNGYPKTLANTTSLLEVPRIGVSGRTVATGMAAIDAELAAYAYIPNYILCNLGANDSLALPAEATWKANYKYILQALHTKFPNAQIYLMRAWRQGVDAACDSMSTWISALVADVDLAGYCHLGPDERVFLKGADNGATYTTDGVHPNAAGHVLTATQWRTALGL